MIRVYEVRAEVDEYQAFLTENIDTLRVGGALRLDGTRKLEEWAPPSLYVDQPRLRVPDIWRIVGCAGLLFEPRLVEHLDVILGTAGELLPIPYKGNSYLLLNILQNIDCLDRDRTRWHGEKYGGSSSPKTYEP